MQYSVRTRRRLRPTTGDQTRAAAAATAIVQDEQLADGTGATRRPLITGNIVERVSPRAVASAFRR